MLPIVYNQNVFVSELSNFVVFCTEYRLIFGMRRDDVTLHAASLYRPF